jgi:1-deoxy-D-xylulose-5-phosphate synthase
MLTHVGFTGNYHLKAIHDKFVKQMSVNEALKMLKLDSEGMTELVIKDLANEKKT